MKKNNILYSIILASLLLVMPGCDDFLDVNDNPTKAKEVNLKVLLPTIIESTSSAHYSAALSAARVTHQVDHFSGYYDEFDLNSVWIKVYLKSLDNAAIMIKQANEGGSPHYEGMGKVIQAINIGMLADLWEDAPFSEAILAEGNITPSYDSQEQLYAAIMTKLNEALPLLSAEESFLSPGSDDLAYGGDLDQWIKLVHSLKARYMLHLSNKPSIDWGAILTEVDAGFTSNGDNFQVVYNSVNKNPIHSGIALSSFTGNLTLTHAKYFIDMMNGAIYTVVDPRLPFMADKGGNDDYVGMVSYPSAAPAHTTEFAVKDSNSFTWYAEEDAPILMMTYAELKFIEAEAALNTDAGRVETAYREGIKGHMDMLGVGDAERMTYMDDPLVALAGVIDLEHIMKEKYISLFMHFESWNDMRRHQYNTNVFKGFSEPDLTADGGRNVPAERALHPSSETNRNGTNEGLFRKDFTARMWKDQN